MLKNEYKGRFCDLFNGGYMNILSKNQCLSKCDFDHINSSDRANKYIDILPFSAVIENNLGFDLHEQTFDDSDIKQKMFYISECIKTGITKIFDVSQNYLLSAKAFLKFDLDVCIGVWLFPEQDITKKLIDEKIKSVFDINNNVSVALVLDNVLLYNEEQISAVVNYAKNNNLYIYTSIAQTLEDVGEYDKETGMSPILYLESLGILDRKCVLGGCSYLEKDDIELLSSYGVKICVMPSKQMSNGDCLPPVYSMLMRGLEICVGFDDKFMPDIFREIHLITCSQSSTLNINNAIAKDDLINCFQIPIISALGASNLEKDYCRINIAKLLDFKSDDRTKISSFIEKGDIIEVVENGKICYDFTKK